MKAALKASDPLALEQKYRLETGRVLMSGIQALVRLPLDQHRADRRRGLDTATLISGYRGSPLGGLDQTLERHRDLLREHQVVFISGVNEDLGATAVLGSQLAHLYPRRPVRRRARHVVRQGAGRRPQRRHLQHANFAGIGTLRRRAGARGDDPLSKSSTLPTALRGRVLRRPDAGALPRQRPGDPRLRPARLRAVALLRALGRLQDRHQRRRRDRHRRGRAGARGARRSRVR